MLRNHSAFGYSLAYRAHTLEINALRGWGVAFLAWVAASTGRTDEPISPAVAVTVLGLLGTVVSVLRNEASIRFGRSRLVAAAMLLSILTGAVIGFAGTLHYWIAAGLIVLYGAIIWLDRLSLTAGSADPASRHRTPSSRRSTASCAMNV